jgi:hypothetical protein
MRSSDLDEAEAGRNWAALSKVNVALKRRLGVLLILYKAGFFMFCGNMGLLSKVTSVIYLERR